MHNASVCISEFWEWSKSITTGWCMNSIGSFYQDELDIIKELFICSKYLHPSSTHTSPLSIFIDWRYNIQLCVSEWHQRVHLECLNERGAVRDRMLMCAELGMTSLSVCDTLIHSPVKMLFLRFSSSDLNGIWPLWWQGTSSEYLLWLQWMRPWSPLGFGPFSGIHLWWGHWWKRPGTGKKVGPSEVGLFSTLFLLKQEG